MNACPFQLFPSGTDVATLDLHIRTVGWKRMTRKFPGETDLITCRKRFRNKFYPTIVRRKFKSSNRSIKMSEQHDR